MGTHAMHDWSLVKLAVDWAAGDVQIDLNSPVGPKSLVARELKSLVVPYERPWGPSTAINEAIGPPAAENGLSRLAIEMQSGDLIQIVAGKFQMPAD